MREEILVNVSSREVRAALLENGVLQEVFLERTSRLGLVGNIYKGQVSRVLPGMQAAFIDIGLQRTAFLHARDIAGTDIEGVKSPSPPNITELVHEGGEILVQVLKDPMGTKGARLTTYVTIPSRFLVYMPRGEGIGISMRLDDEEERRRLGDTVADLIDGDGGRGGYIVRTAAEGASRDALRADMIFLRKLWDVVQEQMTSATVTGLVHEDLTLPLRILRDLLRADVERVRVDCTETFQRMKRFAGTFVPERAPVIEQYTGDRPILDLYNIEEEITRALEQKVQLKSGGYLIIDQTEAMTTIDVNTGAFVGHRNMEETIFRTNLEAAQAIARQLRLRNLGGIIIIDFIDMASEAHRKQVLHALAKNLDKDHAKNYICEVSPLGLVEMTRKRTRESLEHILCMPCPTCEGSGSVKTPETVCYEIFRDIIRQTRQFEFQELMILAHQDVIELLLDEESAALAGLEETTGKPIRLQTDSLYAQDQFDVVLT